MDPRRHLKEVAQLLEEAFGDTVEAHESAPLREMKWYAVLARWLGSWVMGPGVYKYSLISFVWLEQGHVVGHAMAQRLDPQGERWQIANVAVKSAYRNRGIGRALMNALLEYIHSRRGVWAILQVREDNEPAVHLYRDMGFTEIGGEIRWRLDTNAWPELPATRRGRLRRLNFQHYLEIEELQKRCLGPTSEWWWRGRFQTLPAHGFGYWIRRLIGQAFYQRRGMWYNGQLVARAEIRVDRQYRMGDFLLCVDRLYWDRWESDLVLEILAQIRTWGGHTVYTQTPTDYSALQTALSSLGFHERFRLLNMRKPLF